MRAAIRRLRTGVVPSWEIERLSAGYGKAKQIVGDGFHKLLVGERPQPLFVRGEWGSGKTHFLSFVHAAATSRGFPSARVNLNARSAALNYPQRFYGLIAESISRTDQLGLRAIVLGLFHEAQTRERLRAFAATTAAGDLQRPLIQLWQRYERGDELGLLEDPAWVILYGGDLAWADYTYKREQATSRIGALGRLLAAVGLAGLVIAFDEAETVDQLWNARSRMSAYGVLGHLCRLEAVWPVFGITERFDRTIANDLERGVLAYNFVTDSADWFLTSWQRNHFEILQPPSIDARTARALAGTVANLYEEAYRSSGIDMRLVERCVDEWLKNPGRNPRRLIRTLIHRLDICRPLNP